MGIERFINDNNIVKKNAQIEHVLQKANSLKERTQQQLASLTPEQREMLFTAPNINIKEVNKTIINSLQSDNLSKNDSLSESDNLSENDNLSKNDSLFINDNLSISDRLQEENLIKDEINNFAAKEKIANNNSFKEDTNTINNLTAIYNDSVTDNNEKNHINSSVTIEDNSIKNNSTMNNLPINDKKEVSRPNPPKGGSGVMEPKKNILLQPHTVLLEKQKKAYNELVDLQTEFEIVSRMSLRVEEKLKPSYKTKIASIQTQIKEKELRLATIANLLNGR